MSSICYTSPEISRYVHSDVESKFDNPNERMNNALIHIVEERSNARTSMAKAIFQLENAREPELRLLSIDTKSLIASASGQNPPKIPRKKIKSHNDGAVNTNQQTSSHCVVREPIVPPQVEVSHFTSDFEKQSTSPEEAGCCCRFFTWIIDNILTPIWNVFACIFRCCKSPDSYPSQEEVES